MVIVFAFENSNSPNLESSLPYPEAFIPPNGKAG
jgi:hypothetical protein